jgi:tRNA A-37 threonylcarbamoyl transferase component Bud32
MSSGSDRDAELLRRFDELAELAVEDRARRLAALAVVDPALARALQAMLGADDEPGGPLEAGVEGLVEALVSDEGRPLLPGQRIGPFVLERPLGRGGMGEVWLAAREEGGFRQTVALKRLKRGMDSDEILRRFVQERRILADLSHPNIARFIDGGVGADGVPWYAMEYVDGATITAHADARALDVRARVALLAEVAEAVGYAQNRLVVHRDLKPSNILVDGAGVPHLLDFGIAKLLQGGDDPQATATGVRALSPAYAAPEQILDQSISTATDVYALGVVLYELLTGELPHARSGLSLEALVDSVRDETIERPSARLRASTTLAGDAARTQQTLRAVSGELDAIVLTALRREPERRYANTAALGDDLRRWLDGRPVRAQPDTATYRMRKFVVRNKLVVGSASAVLLALIAGFGTALWQAAVARGEAQRAEAQAALARKAQADAEAVNQFFGRMLIDARPLDQGAGANLTVKEWVLAALPRLDRDLGDAPAARATLRRELGTALQQLGDNAQARVVLERAVAENLAAYGDSGQAASASVMLAVNLFALGEHAAARKYAEDAIAIADRAPQDDDVRNLRIQARTTLVRILSLEGDHAGGLVLAEQNLAERAALYGADDPRLAVDYNNLAGSYSRLARLAEAEAAQRKSLALLERNPQRPLARIAFVHGQLCMLGAQRAAYAAALDHCAQASAVYTEALGADSIELPAMAAAEAHVRFAAGDAERAAALLDASEPRLVAAARAVDLRIAWLVRMRLAIRNRQWRAVESIGAQLLAVYPEPAPGRIADERFLADSFIALGRLMRTRDPRDARAAIDAAESMLARTQAVPYFRATAALSASLAAAANGDPAAADAFRARGLAALAQTMPADAAQALWARWLPRGADDAERAP